MQLKKERKNKQISNKTRGVWIARQPEGQQRCPRDSRESMHNTKNKNENVDCLNEDAQRHGIVLLLSPFLRHPYGRRT